MAQSTVESKNKKDINNGKIPAKETILSPRFYTTDFEAMENMDLSINEEELEKIKSYFETGKNVSDEVINLNKVKTKSSSKKIAEKVKIKYFANRLIRKS